MVIEWHNVGEWRFGWVARRDSCRFTVLHRPWWKCWAKRRVVTQGVVEYGLEPRERVLPSAGARLAVVFVTDDGYELDVALKRSMALRWEEMQRRLRAEVTER